MSTTTTPIKAVLSADEQAMYVRALDGGVILAQVSWPPEIYGLMGEPDYEAVTALMYDAVVRVLSTKGYGPDASLSRHVRQLVTPGGTEPFRPFTLQRRAAEMPSTPPGRGDQLDVPIRCGSSKYVTRSVSVYLFDTGEDGDRDTTLPTVFMEEYGRWQVAMTWTEARALARALAVLTDVAERG